jgi:hypothetical protein
LRVGQYLEDAIGRRFDSPRDPDLKAVVWHRLIPLDLPRDISERVIRAQ